MREGLWPIIRTARLDIMGLVTTCIARSESESGEVISKVNDRVLMLLHEAALYEQALRTIPRLKPGDLYEFPAGKFVACCVRLCREHAEFRVLCWDSGGARLMAKVNGCVSIFWGEAAYNDMKRIEEKDLALYVGYKNKSKQFNEMFKGGA